MGTQPTHDDVGFPIGQHLDRTMGLQIDQQRAVAVTFFPGEIVQTQHLRGLACRNTRAADEPQERITARGHRQALRQLCACFASLREGDLHQGLGLSQGAPGVGVRERREAFRKGGARAAMGSAPKAAHLQAHAHRSLLAGQIGQSACVVAMHLGRWLGAFRARSGALTRSQHQSHSLVLQPNINETQIGRQRE